jgi:ribosome-associated translation inhibitor RaiA
MRLTIQHMGLRSTHVLDSWVEQQIFSLEPVLQITEADVHLKRDSAQSPAYSVHIEVATWAENVSGCGSAPTLRAAVSRAVNELRRHAETMEKRLGRSRNKLQIPAAKARQAAMFQAK